jgi:hypothetical protein
MTNDFLCSLIRGTIQPILDGTNSAITIQNKKLRQINTITEKKKNLIK